MDKIISKIVERQLDNGERTVLHPDPFWPEGVEPTHLTPEQKAAAIELGTFVALKEGDWKCEKCGATDKPSKNNVDLCVNCEILDSKQVALAKKTNSTWMETAMEFGLELFERQPEESDTDWRIWEVYRSHYPLKLPTYSDLAKETGCAVGTVVNAAQRWSYKVRILAWARFCDADIQQKRVETVREMNTKQLEMSTTLLNKVGAAIDLLEPENLRPGEIVNLFKVATELQRKSAMHVEETIVQPAIADKTAKATNLTKPEDISEIAAILKKAGALEGQTVVVETAQRITVRGENE